MCLVLLQDLAKLHFPTGHWNFLLRPSYLGPKGAREASPSVVSTSSQSSATACALFHA
jgi:hypothetical protein